MAIRWISPQVLTFTCDGAYHDYDVSALVSASATGIFLHIYSANVVRLRKNGSITDKPLNGGHYWSGVGLDAGKIFEYLVTNAGSATVYLVGYTESETVWLTNAVQKTLSGAGAFEDIDISGEVGADTPIAVFGFSADQVRTWAIRNNGSTDDHYQYGNGRHFLVGVDGSKLFEAKVSNVDQHIYITGYVKSGANLTALVNSTDLSLGSTGAYADLTALPANGTGGFIEINLTAALSYTCALRTKGDLEEVYQNPSYHSFAFLGADANRIIEGKVNSTAVDFYLTAYTTTPSSTVPGYKSLKGVGI